MARNSVSITQVLVGVTVVVLLVGLFFEPVRTTVSDEADAYEQLIKMYRIYENLADFREILSFNESDEVTVTIDGQEYPLEDDYQPREPAQTQPATAPADPEAVTSP